MPGAVRTAARSAILATAGASLGAAGCWRWRHQRSAAVAAWSRGGGRQRQAGPLSVRVLGTAQPVLVLLHGMVAAGNCFGAAYDELAQRATLVIPDLLGFGGSMLVSGPTDATAHMDALDEALAALGLDRRPLAVAGHSMGGALALRWAARHAAGVGAVVTFGAPLYRTPAEADEHVAAMGSMEALLAGDGALPRAVCGWMCRHRTAASWVAAAYRPDLPVPVARAGVKHTWHTYTGSMNGLIRDAGWQPAPQVLSRAGVPVVLVAGDADPVPVLGRAAELAAAWPTVIERRHPSADHGLPLTHPVWCTRLVANSMAAFLRS